jgi:hypothetical protein
MVSFLGLVLHVLASPFRSRARLEAEVVFLRHQLNLLRRRLPGKPRLTPADRLLLALSPCAVAAERCGHHPTGYDRAMAPSGVPLLLALEIAFTRRSAQSSG